MNDDIRTLLEAIRRGQFDDPSEKIALLAAALREQGATLADLLPLLRAPQVPLRLAGLEASRSHSDPAVVAEVLRLAGDSDSQVRERLADLLAQKAIPATPAALEALLSDREFGVRLRACKAASELEPFQARLRALAEQDDQWGVRQAAIQALGEVADSDHAGLLVRIIAEDADDDVRQLAAANLEKVVAEPEPASLVDCPSPNATLIKALSQLEGSWGGARFTRVKAWLKRRTDSMVDVPGLSRFGTDLTAQLASVGLPRAHEVGGSLAMLLDWLRREPARPMALVGRSGCGKTALVNELVRALALPENGGWRVLRMAPADFVTGTKYVGEWETRVRDLVAAIRYPRRVLLYVPNLGDLAAVGRSEKSDANVAAALAQHLEEGSIRLLGESTPEDFERGLGRESALVRLFDRVLVEPASVAMTRRVVRAMRDQAEVPAADAVLDELVDASEFYLGHVARPGGAAGLLRAVMESRRGKEEPIQRREILATLSKSTGVPVDLLDDSAPLDLAALRGFFEARIIGQTEPVQAVVDLVTLVKAGVTDPNRPFGVMLFVGPTGVGKTELARVLAEYIFGDPGRLVRFDMSEFASPDGFMRLIGGRGENGLLTDAVRQRPFSVILLDEIEKSHVNVFDLCLQIFDAGRLTDGHGRLVDFRRSIVILTSNVGAETPVAQVGFGGQAGPRDFGGGGSGLETPAVNPDADRTFRELARFFRPEFLNRLDRIVHFAPLSLDVAERIARRELDLVLQRSGVARRNLSVMVDPEVITLLVREGYSPHFGARPLKRTVERMVLLPLGRALATGRLGSRDLVTLRAREGRVDVSVASRPVVVQEPGPSLTPARDAGHGIAECLARVDALRERLIGSTERKTELMLRTQEPGFYADLPRREATFDELHKLDAFLVRAERCCGAIAGLAASKRATTPQVAGRWDELDEELRQLEFIATCRDARDLGDAVVTVRWVSGKGEGLETVAALIRMYQGLADRRHMAASVVAEHEAEGADTAYLQVTGLGAFALMADEVGLHEFRRRLKIRVRRGAPEREQEDVAVVSVEVVPLAGAPSRKFVSGLTVRAVPLRPPVSRLLENAGWQVEAFDATTVRSLEGRFCGTRKVALDGATALLWSLTGGGRTDGPMAGPMAVVRQYDLGQGACVRDLRTGRSTTRVAHVFRGQLELLARK